MKILPAGELEAFEPHRLIGKMNEVIEKLNALTELVKVLQDKSASEWRAEARREET